MQQIIFFVSCVANLWVVMREAAKYENPKKKKKLTIVNANNEPKIKCFKNNK